MARTALEVIDEIEAVETSRVFLRQTMPDQIDDHFLRMFLNIGGKNAHFRLSGKEFSRDELIDFCRDGIAKGNVFYYSICDRRDGEVIGAVRIGPIDFQHSLSDMPTVIGDVENRGRGLGTEAIIEGIRIAFDVHNIRKLSGGVLEPNVASLKAFTRAGWTEEGRLRNHYIHEGRLVDWIVLSCFNPAWRA